MSDERAPSAPESVHTEFEGRLCDQCRAPLVFRKKIRTRRFCNDHCRNEWHLAERRRTEERAKAVVVELQALFDKFLSKRHRR